MLSLHHVIKLMSEFSSCFTSSVFCHCQNLFANHDSEYVWFHFHVIWIKTIVICSHYEYRQYEIKYELCSRPQYGTWHLKDHQGTIFLILHSHLVRFIAFVEKIEVHCIHSEMLSCYEDNIYTLCQKKLYACYLLPVHFQITLTMLLCHYTETSFTSTSTIDTVVLNWTQWCCSSLQVSFASGPKCKKPVFLH